MGKIFKDDRDGRWRTVVPMPGGKRKNVYGKTRREVQESVAQLQREIDAGLYAVGNANKLTFKEYCQQWYELNESRLSMTTRIGYQGFIRNHISRFKEWTLAELKPSHFTQVYREMLSETIPGGKTRTGKTVLNFHRFCHEVLKNAELEELIQRNPTDHVHAPSSASPEIEPFSEKEAMQLVEKTREHRLWAAIVVALTTGVREGELLGLQWDDVDWSRQLLHIRRQLKRVEGKYQLLKTKSYSSKRTLPLPEYTQEALRLHKERLKGEQDIVGEAWERNDLIFPSQIGQPLNSAVFRRQFQKMCSMAHVPVRRPHDLRHTFATLLLEHSVNIKAVSELLGHSSVDITLRIYGHVTPRMRDTAIDEMNAILPSLPTFATSDNEGKSTK